MNTTYLVQKIFKFALSFYPSAFQAEFAEEMQVVFNKTIEGKKQESLAKAFVFCMHELKAFPGNLLNQYQFEYQQRKIMMSSKMKNYGNDHSRETAQPLHTPGTWGEAILGGLPHALMGLLIGVGKFVTANGSYRFSQSVPITIGVSLGILVVGLLIIAWRKGWPLWSASWYLYGTWMSVAIIGLVIEGLNLQESWRYTNALFLVWIALCLIGYFSILVKDRLRGLVSVAFLFPFLGLMMLEFIPNQVEGLLAIVLGFLSALSVGTIIRFADYRIGLRLIIGINLLAGLTLAYVNEYQMKDLPLDIPPHVPDFTGFLVHMAFYSVIALGIIATPLILRYILGRGKRQIRG